MTIEPIVGSDVPIGKSVKPISQISDSGLYTFSFEPIRDSLQQDYYIKFQMVGTGVANVGVSTPFTYLNGSLYENDQPVDQQLVFNLVYDPIWVLIGLLKELLIWICVLFVGIFLFVLPGWGLLSLCWDEWNDRSVVEKFLLSTGLSLAIYPVLMLWLDLIGLQVGVWLALIPSFCGIAIIVWGNRNFLNRKNIKLQWIKSNSSIPPIFVFLFVVCILIITRFWSIRNIEVPLWGDSYHHTMISQLIVDNKGLFNSWEPYADLSSFSYHFGFHTLVANFHWITHLTLPHSVLWVGQILNILAVLVLYPLVIKLGGNRWAGLIALLFSGMLISLPMFYVNWGRYTQLAGLVILPIAMFFIWDTVERDEISWKSIIIPSILLAGLALTHYRVIFFALGFMIIILIYHIQRIKIKAILIKAFLIGIGSSILFLPWFIHVYGSTVLRIFGDQISTSAGAIKQSTVEYNSIGNISYYMPIWAWMITGIVLIIGIIRRRIYILLVVLWCMLLLVSANPNWIGLPGTGALSNFAIFISVYIPASLLIGLITGDIIEEILSRYAKYQKVIFNGICLFIIVLSIWGFQQRISDVNIENYALVTRPDIRAMNWILEKVPQKANFLVNSFLAYGGTLAVGSDGGLWIPLLARRDSILPPITYGFEQGIQTDNLKNTNNLIETLLNLGPTDPEAIQMLLEKGVTHVYVGQRRGRVNYSGPDMLDPTMLSANPNYQPIYHEDLVWIFRIIP